MAQLSKITGLAPLKKVQSATITREGVRKFLEEKLKDEVKPEEIQQEELAMKRFGLLPEKFDLKAATVDLIPSRRRPSTISGPKSSICWRVKV